MASKTSQQTPLQKLRAHQKLELAKYPRGSKEKARARERFKSQAQTLKEQQKLLTRARAALPKSQRKKLKPVRALSPESIRKQTAKIKKEGAKLKQRKPRSVKPSSKILIDSKGRLYGTTFTWHINYQADLWARFLSLSLIEANKVFPTALCRFYVEIKGNGTFTTKSGNVPKKGRLVFISSPIFEVVDIQMDGTLFALALYVGPIDFPIVKKIRLAIYPVEGN